MTTFQFPARLPADVKDWLQQQASLHGSSMNSEVIRALRERMVRVEKEAANDSALPADQQVPA